MTKRLVNAAKGRARRARPSLCLLSAVTALGASLAFTATAAAEEPPIPVITGTNPLSSFAAPAQQTKPLLFGEAEPDGSHTSSVEPPFDGEGLLTMATKHPEYVIKVYANDSGCTGSPVAEATAGTFESPGIEVTVAENSTNIFYVRQVNPAEPGTPSACSEGRTYWHSTTPVTPPAEGGGSGGGGGATGGDNGGSGGGGGRPDPPRIHTVPSGWANDNTPLVAGAAPGAASVRIFESQDCSGGAVAKGSAGQLAVGIQVPVPDNVLVALTAISVASGGAQSRCSAPIFYVEDSTAPHTRITMGPASKTRRHTAVFRFTDTTGDAPGTVFRCKIDRRKWKPCSSPLKLRRLHRGRYQVQVKATDPAGNAERKPAKRRFRVIAAA